jgi:hypothetical protein
MRTISNKRYMTPLDYSLDGSAVNLPEEDSGTEEPEKKEDDTPDLDEDILMYMIHI